MIERKRPESAMWGRSILIACTLFLCAGSVFAGANRHRLASDLQNLKPTDKVDLIVQYKSVPSSAMHKRALRLGGTMGRQYRRLSFGSYRGIPASALSTLSGDSNIVHISRDRKVNAASNGNNVAVLDLHNETMGTANGWAQGLDGKGIGVAVIDSGVTAVNDLGSRVVYSQDFVAVGGTGADQYGHGTHVAGIVAGDGVDSTGPDYTYTFKGVAPKANIINLRVLGPDGSGQDSDVIAAIDRAVELKETYNIRVLNLSLGRGVYESYVDDPLCQAVERAWNAGIFVVVSAGNEGRNNAAGTNGYGTITAPGNDPYVITVGALNTLGTPDPTDDIPGSYSSKGPTLFDHFVKPDIVAPGNQIVSLYTPQETLNASHPEKKAPHSLYVAHGDNTGSSSYYILSGTSMAAPMVSGAAALLLQKDSALTPDQLKIRLMKTAFKNLQPASSITDPTSGETFNMQADIFTVGSGLLDIDAALDDNFLAPATAGVAATPAVQLDANGNISIAMQPNLVLWGSGAADSELVLWGSSVFTNSGELVLWGSNTTGSELVLWGSDTLSSELVLWGSSTDNSELVLWGSNSDAALDVISGDSK